MHLILLEKQCDIALIISLFIVSGTKPGCVSYLIAIVVRGFEKSDTKLFLFQTKVLLVQMHSNIRI